MEVRTRSGRKNVLILVDEDVPIGNDFSAFKMFYLDSLMIKRKTIYKKWVEPVEDPDRPKDFKLHTNPDQVVKFDNPNFNSYTTVMEALQGRVPGLTSGRNSSIMRGPSSIYGSNEPLYLIDGMETDYRGIQSVNVHDIDHVDILKGPSSAIYGVRGSNGVVAVYTKKGYYYKRGEIRFKMLGYHKAKQFYSPKYQAKNIDMETSDLRKTVYWNPSIKPNKEGKAHVSFYQSVVIDQFEIVIEGMSKNGQVGIYKYNYEVKELN
jgi:TonB-dependent SusC/RagA subfamily outer membrane receptor